MKRLGLNSSIRLFGCGVLSALAGLALCSALLMAPSPVDAQSYDFNNGNDTGWTRYDPLGPPLPFGPQAVFSFPNGAYRIQTPPSPAPGLPPAGYGPGRAGSVITGANYTDFYVAVDVLAFDAETDQAFGILARVSNAGLGSLNCYAFTWETGNDLDISVVEGEVPLRQIETDPGRVVLETAKDYRFVFIGKGDKFEARIYELPNVTTPIITATGTDSTYPSGGVGLVVYDNSDLRNNITDATFDNFVAQVAESPKMTISLNSFGEAEVRWLADSGPFRLQSSTRVPNASWLDVDPALISDALPYKVYLEGTDAARTKIFRLIQD